MAPAPRHTMKAAKSTTVKRFLPPAGAGRGGQREAPATAGSASDSGQQEAPATAVSGAGANGRRRFAACGEALRATLGGFAGMRGALRRRCHLDPPKERTM